MTKSLTPQRYEPFILTTDAVNFIDFQVQSVLRELLTEVSLSSYYTFSILIFIQSSAHRMELIIILLISVEVVIVSFDI